MSVTDFPVDLVEGAIANLKTSAPEENEINIFTTTATELDHFNSIHDDFLGSLMSRLELSGGGEATEFVSVNESYNNLIEDVSRAYEQIIGYSDGDGDEPIAPNEHGGNGGNNSSGGNGGNNNSGGNNGGGNIFVGPGEEQNNDEGKNPNQNENSDDAKSDDILEESETPTNPEDEKGPLEKPSEEPNSESEKPFQNDDENSNEEQNNESKRPDPETIASSLIGSVIVGGEIIPEETPNNPMGDFKISKEVWDNLTPKEKKAIEEKLRELGYSEEEIAAIENGEMTVPDVLVSALKTTLERIYKEHPEIRDTILKEYGIDIYNDDGTINEDKLAIALLMDDKKPSDKYSLIQLLKDKYNMNLVSQEEYQKLSEQLKYALLKDPSLRQKIKEKYGFDIYNEDGSINQDRLVLAMLMDQKESNDDFELKKYLLKNYGDLASVGKAVIEPQKPIPNEETKGSGESKLAPIVGTVAAAGAIGGGALLAKKMKEDQEENPSENKLKLKSRKRKKESKENKEWLNRLGIGVGAAATYYAVNDEDDDDKDNEYDDFYEDEE